VSIAIGLATAILFGLLSTSKHVSIWWFAAFGLIWLAGLIDDIRGLSPFLKLAAQIGAGVILWSGGWSLPGHFPALAEILIICAMVVLFANAFNFLDGSDGLAAGVAAIIGLAYVLGLGGTSDFAPLVAGALAGATLGFLFSNFPPAKIFMGDSGSTVLGFCVAFLSLDFLKHAQAQNPTFKWIFPLLIAGLPLIDGIVVVLRRLIRGVSPLHGDRFHYYDRWLKNGWSPLTVAAISYAISALLAATGLWLIGREIPAMILFAAVAVIGLLVVGFKRAHADGSLRRAIREQAES
jgi:UDP-N-acetylmuramyl pentapeptide phosphotransferase/UDP-N-acetylglucosamine-1-phosphate transferase